MQRLLRLFPTAGLEQLLVQAVQERMGRLRADDALRFWFRISAGVYPLLGRCAVDYGGGVHTKHRHTGYHDFFVRNIQNGERVLDIGCGIGAVSHDIAVKAQAQVLGVDVSASNISIARQQYQHPKLRFEVRDATQTSFDGTFEVVVLSNILEHLPERPEFLRRVQRAAQPSRMLIRVPLFERDWQVPLKKELGVEWRLDATHQTEYTCESFADEIADAGLRIVHQEVRWGEIWAEVMPYAA